jgi:O-acetylserine/cysteine efflux transporter
LQPIHLLLALGVALIWGVNFVIIAWGLTELPPLLMAALRFSLAALPAFFLPRPKLSWPTMIAIAAALFVGHYAFLYPAMAVGMPPGLASIALQVQAFFTIAIAAVILGERPGPRRIAGSAIAFLGLALIATTVGGDVTVAGFALTMAAAACWGTGNVLLRRAGSVDMLATVTWLSIVPPLPLLAMSLVIEGPAEIATSLAGIGWVGIGAVFYMAFLSTTFGFGVWGHLLKLYPAATVAPFSLLVPVFGMSSAAFLVGETFSGMRLAGGALILIGLAIVALRRRPPPVPVDTA